MTINFIMWFEDKTSIKYIILYIPTQIKNLIIYLQVNITQVHVQLKLTMLTLVFIISFFNLQGPPLTPTSFQI